MCAVEGGCDGGKSFAPATAECIINFSNTRSCLAESLCECGRSYEQYELTVPENYNHISGALQDASCGSTISIRAGDYSESTLVYDLVGVVVLEPRSGTVRIAP